MECISHRHSTPFFFCFKIKAELIALFFLMHLKKCFIFPDCRDGHIWSSLNSGLNLPRASSTQAVVQLQEDSVLTWDIEPPELVLPYQEELDATPFIKAAFKGDFKALQQMSMQPFTKEAELALNIASRKGKETIPLCLLALFYEWNLVETSLNAARIP